MTLNQARAQVAAERLVANARRLGKQAQHGAMTLNQAREALMAQLAADGWEVQVRSKATPWKALKVPYASKGKVRLWFKARAVYVSTILGATLGDARSLWSDVRELNAARVNALLGKDAR